MAKREKKMSRYNDAKTPTEKPLRNPVGRGQGGRAGPAGPPVGQAGPRAEAPGGQPEALPGACYLVGGIWGQERCPEPEEPAST